MNSDELARKLAENSDHHRVEWEKRSRAMEPVRQMIVADLAAAGCGVASLTDLVDGCTAEQARVLLRWLPDPAAAGMVDAELVIMISRVKCARELKFQILTDAIRIGIGRQIDVHLWHVADIAGQAATEANLDTIREIVFDSTFGKVREPLVMAIERVGCCDTRFAAEAPGTARACCTRCARSWLRGIAPDLAEGA